MVALSALVLFLVQDPIQSQIDDALRGFEAAAEVDQALTILSARLIALGTNATNPIARRLAQDLRDGMASAAAPAFIDALMGRTEALPPLQDAFRDAATSAAGRVELAEALLHLDDALTWRAGLLALASDDRGDLGDRLRAARVLLEADDVHVPAVLRRLVDSLPGRPAAERDQILSFLKAANTPLTRELLDAVPSARREADDPGVRIVDERSRPVSGPSARPPGKKKETRRDTFFTMPTILAGGVTLVLLVLLGIEVLRKG